MNGRFHLYNEQKNRYILICKCHHYHGYFSSVFYNIGGLLGYSCPKCYVYLILLDKFSNICSFFIHICSVHYIRQTDHSLKIRCLERLQAIRNSNERTGYSRVTRHPVFEGGVPFSDKEKTECQVVPFFNIVVMFITDTDFSLLHASSSWSLDA
jgi:hypothetical protein